MNGGWGISYENALRWMPLNITDEKSTLVQVMAWCRQATSHYLSRCWPRSLSPFGVTRPQWVDSIRVRLRRGTCLVTCFCCQMTAKPGNKTATPLGPEPAIHNNNWWPYVDNYHGIRFSVSRMSKILLWYSQPGPIQHDIACTVKPLV